MALHDLASSPNAPGGIGEDAAGNRSTKPRSKVGAGSVPGGMHTLVLTGELDRVSAHTLEAAIEELCDAGVGGITLDLRGLSRIDSTGVAVIAFRSGACRRRGHEFALIPGPWFIQRAFALAGLTERLPFLSRDEIDAAPAREARAEAPAPAVPERPALARISPPPHGQPSSPERARAFASWRVHAQAARTSARRRP
jgi:anti-sigma B factor antagonist